MKMDYIFIYHLDYELHKLFGLYKQYSNKEIYACFNLITRVAYLLCEKSILVPASNYFESDLAFLILNRLHSLNTSNLGTIQLLSSSYNLDELLGKKLIQHGDSIKSKGYHYADFMETENKKKIYLPGTMKRREISASRDIQKAWVGESGINFLAKEIYDVTSKRYKASRLEDVLYNIPQKLGNQAYLSQYIVPLLRLDKRFDVTIDRIVNLFITREYIKSFLDEFHAVCLKDIPLIDASIVLPNEREYTHLSYSYYMNKLYKLDYKGIKASKFIEKCSAEELFEFKQSFQWEKITEHENKKDIILLHSIKKEMLNTNDFKGGNVMYYQILVETNEKVGKSRQNKVITEIDKNDKDEILKNILIPYLENNEFLFNGYILSKKDIVRLKIVTTEQSARQIAKQENDNMPSGLIMYVSPEDILSYDNYVTDVTNVLLSEAKSMINEPNSRGEQKKEILDKTKVFIVHGRDNEAKLEVARFIEKMGFEPIILHEQPSEGMTIIEKIEKYSNVGFGIVLYTPCDVGYKKDEENSKMFRARQNVVFEHGYLIAKLGRNNVCALVTKEVEKPNDISGVVYIALDSNGGWKIPLAKEMKSSGYEIDFNLFM